MFGGHVVSFQPQGQRPNLDESTKLNSTEKQPYVAVSQYWPWFGRIAAPAHGFARSSEWQLV
ncbi:hypothetical protein O9929_10030 [Vibrio lentus]|nr:hypothetical protein [Vibrio lentus]